VTDPFGRWVNCISIDEVGLVEVGVTVPMPESALSPPPGGGTFTPRPGQPRQLIRVPACTSGIVAVRPTTVIECVSEPLVAPVTQPAFFPEAQPAARRPRTASNASASLDTFFTNRRVVTSIRHAIEGGPGHRR
jgi:hypothetical protein